MDEAFVFGEALADGLAKQFLFFLRACGLGVAVCILPNFDQAPPRIFRVAGEAGDQKSEDTCVVGGFWGLPGCRLSHRGGAGRMQRQPGGLRLVRRSTAPSESERARA